ncbi:transcriptional regulator [Salipaludibacillus neizhouensis]|uniref:Transcriptional regulator n=1 Tax=Salipaludibacillus neizhouensis TaxID=885475 RepID=A0A3A9K1X8_9BACI|nr:transcriptional regulator GutM [Salipaludibacillus neizhouensis]RKL64910.1 transcriptional regulator [Salipaludibacillus neizhouensis]
MIIYLIILIGLAWLVQSFLGFLQIQHFNKHFVEMRRKGKVAIGRRRGFFRAGTVVLLGVNSRKEIIDARKMQGITVLSKVKVLKGLEQKSILKIKEVDLKQYDVLTAASIQDAVFQYKTVVLEGGEVLEHPSLFKKISNKFLKLKEG